MKVVHMTAHLGGGVGKAHAAILAADPQAADHTFVLLESARDRRYLEAIEKAGAHVLVTPQEDVFDRVLAGADIVQVEFWNHPRLYEFLARKDLPPMRTLFWCHISGLAPPLIAPGLAALADAFVFTSACSLTPEHEGSLHVIGSGFGLDPVPARLQGKGKVRVAYLGTVDFVKMHPAFFDIVDAVGRDDFEVRVYGSFDPHGAPAQAWRAMRHSDRVRLMGHVEDPAEALAGCDIFLYPLARGHFGTAENALVEAMSAGAAPLVLDNPAECAIVEDGVTGRVAASVEDCAAALAVLIGDADLRTRLGDGAAAHAAARFRPELSGEAFRRLYTGLLALPKRAPAFRAAIGDGPIDWYLSGFPQGDEAHGAGRPSKGSLAHFLACFPDDPGLCRQAAAADKRHGNQE